MSVKKTLVNGRVSDQVSVSDRGLAYGDGVFETIRVNAGVPEFLDLHLQRLQRGCTRLGIHYEASLIACDIDQLLASCEQGVAVMKIIVTRGQGGRGYQPDKRAGSHRVLSLQRIDGEATAGNENGIAARLCDMRLAINPQLAGIKHLSRLENVVARAEWDDSAIAEGIMLDTDGRVVEGTMSNIFLVKEGRLLTPSLHRCGVEGIIRQVIIDRLSGRLGKACDIVDIRPDDLYEADELFVCNSLIGVWPVLSLGCHKKRAGPVAGQIQKALTQEVVRSG